MRQFFLLGCLLVVGPQQRLFSQACQLQTGTVQGMGQLAKTTGNPLVDASINSELSALYVAFQVRPGFFILNDAGASNAFAMPDTLQPGTTGTVAFGYYLMNEEFLKSGPIKFSISAIMAHEFSHIVQFKRGSSLGLTQRELQADYLAGWYVGKRQSRATVPGTLENILRSFFEHGSYDFNNPQFHGTPEQRVQAVMTGFHHSDVSLSSAYATADSYVQGANIGDRPDTDRERSASFANQRDQPSGPG